MQRKPAIGRTIIPLVLFLFLSPSLFAQSMTGSNVVIYTLVVVGVILILGVIFQVADNMIRIEAGKRNVSQQGIGLVPKFSDMFKRKLPGHLADGNVHILRKGHDIMLEGEASGTPEAATHVTRFAVQPPNWRGIKPIPKVEVAVGETVQAGDPLFFDKPTPEIKYAAPVSGEVIAVNRGAKRSITEIVILADREQQQRQFEAPDFETASRDELVAFLQASGGWVHIRQRPYDIVADSNVEPANIFVSTFDTAPLAPDQNLVLEGKEAEFHAGLKLLSKLTTGKVYLGLDGRGDQGPASVYVDADAEKHWFRGPHPAGNVGVQIHHIHPISGSSPVWVLGVQDVATLGGLILNGSYDASRVIALTGSPLTDPKYVRTYAGANIGELVKDNLESDHVRLVSGDLLSGQAKSSDGYLNIYDDQLSVIEEGDSYDMFGWLFPSKMLPSISKTYPGFLLPDLKYNADTNTHGERRAFVVTGQYESVLPMDIYPQHLFKAILANNFERMEGLGIYELSEEDVALCEFACTSKQPLQKILRDGLELMREQG